MLTHEAKANLNVIRHDYVFVKTVPKLKIQKIDLDEIHYLEVKSN